MGLDRKGLVGALIAFVLYVYGIITAYSSDPFSGALLL